MAVYLFWRRGETSCESGESCRQNVGLLVIITIMSFQMLLIDWGNATENLTSFLNQVALCNAEIALPVFWICLVQAMHSTLILAH